MVGNPGSPAQGRQTAPVTDARKAIEGCLIGGAVGDTIGLPYEGLTPVRARKLFPYPLRQRLVFGKGMFSDDTEHAMMTARAILSAENNLVLFRKRLAWNLRWWLLGLPAGTGMATLKACMKLWLGFPANHSGVNSAGNGPAMRSPILGVMYGSDPDLLKKFVFESTRITHTHPGAYAGALLVALAAHTSSVTSETSSLRKELTDLVWKKDSNGELLFGLTGCGDMMDYINDHSRESVHEFCENLGLHNGVTGYIGHTVPVCLHIWLQRPDDYRWCIEQAVDCGGDTDTIAAILGSLVGIRTGTERIPKDWLDNINEWPRGINELKHLAKELNHAQSEKQSPTNRTIPMTWWLAPAIIVRNLLFLVIVLIHGFRRLLPPW